MAPENDHDNCDDGGFDDGHGDDGIDDDDDGGSDSSDAGRSSDDDNFRDVGNGGDNNRECGGHHGGFDRSARVDADHIGSERDSAEDCDVWFRRPFDFPGNTFSNCDATDPNSSSPTIGDEDDISVGGPDISGKRNNYYSCISTIFLCLFTTFN